MPITVPITVPIAVPTSTPVIHKLDLLQPPPTLKRVAAYCRVSSGKDAMLHSLSAQISHYSKYIQQHNGWIFAGVFADEAYSGTKDARLEFQRLLTCCRAREIDIVLVKSISRFARNTVTLISTTRELKALGVDVFFERENIHSTSGEGELILTILAGYAQEESRSVSENCKWHVRKSFREGKATSGKMLGYRLRRGQLVIVPDEADVARSIFADYLAGGGTLAISKKLRAMGFNFNSNNVKYILTNEKYIGDMLLQKYQTIDHLSKKKVANKGELPQFYVTGSHEPIISKDIFIEVQAEIKRRARHFHPSTDTPKRYLFSGIIHCGICGATYHRKIAGTSKIPVWICKTYNFIGKKACASQQIPESILIAKVDEVTSASSSTIKEILVPAHNRLVFVFHDGTSTEVSWENPSRSHSWTPEMRIAAATRATACAATSTTASAAERKL